MHTVRIGLRWLAAAALLLGLGGCGVFCSGAGTNGWAGGACGTTVRFEPGFRASRAPRSRSASSPLSARSGPVTCPASAFSA
ncbi:hypothetical protein [Burkholderia gladioli]|nr:hypothetical protein [Burkholderia gladioli]